MRREVGSLNESFIENRSSQNQIRQPQRSSQNFGRSSRQSRRLPSHIQNELQCGLCAEDYDLNEHVCMMLCENQHNCCLECVKQVVSIKQECPFCRKKIRKERIKRNRILSQTVASEAKRTGRVLLVKQSPEGELTVDQGSAAGSGSHIVEDGSAPANEQQEALLGLLLALNNINRAVNVVNAQNIMQHQEEQSCCCCGCCEEIDMGSDKWACRAACSGLYLLIYNIPFLIVELYYGLSLPEQNCMDLKDGVGSSLRDWLLVSGGTGLGLFTCSVLYVCICQCCKSQYSKYIILLKTGTVLGYAGFWLKFFGMNIWGLIVNSEVSDEDAESCDQGVLAYMKALLIIEIVIASLIVVWKLIKVVGCLDESI